VRIEVLYVAECPHLPAALVQLNHVLAVEGIQADVRRILVEDEEMAQQLQFRGSPTIRIDGRDIAEESEEPQGHSSSYGLTCRLYPGNKAGVPSLELIRRAVREARRGTDS